MTDQFELNPKLESDLLHLGDFELCQVRMMPSEFNPWLVLVPRRNQIEEWHHLDLNEQRQLLNELSHASRAIEELFQPTTLNIGALGNIVRQFHLHIIGRFETDPSWPGPVWGKDRGSDQNRIAEFKTRLQTRLFA
jgi:diadenosine tetraphosphate (Ap4A) HIT family hydrolase